MSTDVNTWPLVEPVVIKHMNAALAPTRASTDLPAKVETLPAGFVRVTRAPGGSDDYVTDTAPVDVEAFHADRVQAMRLAERARAAIQALAGETVENDLVDDVETSSAPVWVYYGASVHRYVATYTLALRRVL